MSGTYFQYPVVSGTGGGASQSSVSFSIGTLDGGTASPNGASVSSNSIFLQSASTTNPGLVSSANQSFAGTKSFTVPALFADGSVNAPSISFINETTTGLFRNGQSEIQIVASACMAIDIVNLGLQQPTVGICCSASNNVNTPFQVIRSLNATLFNLFQNVSNNTASGAVWILRSGNSSNDVTLENYAKLNAGYLIETGILSASGNLLNLNVMSEFSDGRVRFNIGGRTLATEIAKVSSAGYIINPKYSFAMTGSSSGGFQIFSAGSSTTFYSLTMPPIQGTANQFMQNDGSGNLIWASRTSAGLVGSISLTTQVSGVLPTANIAVISINSTSQVSGSISLTAQVSGVLPTSQIAVISINSTSQVSGSISLTAQITGILPIINGGTNASSSAQAFLNITPTTTSGDLIVSSGTAGQVLTRIGIGTGPGGQVLSVSTGSLIASWQTLTAPTKQIFTSLGSASYFTPAGCRFIKVTVTGGGGGGGGAASGAAQAAGGGGGGGGGTAIKWFTPTPLQVFAITVGSGGLGGLAGANAGITGSQSNFATILGTAGAGGGSGGLSAAAVINAFGGNSGSGSNGDINLLGGVGGYALVLSTTQGLGGGGGSSYWGGMNAPAQNAPGSAASTFGVGGGGASSGNNSGTQIGGIGNAGIVLVEEFYQ